MRHVTAHAPCLPGLLSPLMETIDPVTTEIRVTRVHKRQRGTARGAYALKRAKDQQKADVGQETREGQVLRCLAAYFNRFNRRPTALELLRWMKNRGERVFDVNSVRPRISALVAAQVVTGYPKRICRVSGLLVTTWGVKER